MKILVISSCTKEKKFKIQNQANAEELDNPETREIKTAELWKYRTPALEMYTGDQHKFLIEGLNKLWDKYGNKFIDLYIVSAGYGLISANELIIPYEVTFSFMGINKIINRSKKLQIKEKCETLIKNYDLIFYLLGAEYIRALRLPFNLSEKIIQIFFIGPSHKKLIPVQENNFIIESGNKEAKLFHIKTLALKGYMFKKICENILNYGEKLINEIYKNPYLINDILKNSLSDKSCEQLSIFQYKQLYYFGEIIS